MTNVLKPRHCDCTVLNKILIFNKRNKQINIFYSEQTFCIHSATTATQISDIGIDRKWHWTIPGTNLLHMCGLNIYWWLYCVAASHTLRPKVIQ